MIPKPTMFTASSHHTSATSSNQTREARPVQVQQSAPVSIPRWPKRYHKKKSKKNENVDDDDDDEFDGDGDDDDDKLEEEEKEETDKLPPHELIARRLARTHTTSFSVLEGVGRKLRGRDLSEVRNAILTKTGFLESL